MAARSFASPRFNSAAVREIDLSIVTYNSGRWLTRFFDSLLAQHYPTRQIHLWIVDHGSSDDTQATLERLRQRHASAFASWTFERRGNLGFGAGHNANARKGRAEWIVITNVDLEFEPESMRALLALATTRSDAGAVEARQWPVEHPKYYDPVTLETAWNAHACVAVRRRAFEDVGGYDERFFMYGEDVDFSFRLRSRGWKLLYCPQARVRHYTYSGTDHVKPLQDRYAKLANAYLRLRFGTMADKLRIIPLQLGALKNRSRYPGAKAGYVANILDIARNFSHFSRGGYSKQFFDGWHYELRRHGIEKISTEENGSRNGPLVSVILRTHGKRQFLLRQALKSVANQTYRNLEVVVSEDGGWCAKELVGEFARESGLRTRYLANAKIGRSATGNRAMEACTGDFIVFLDDDDLFFPDHIETLVDAARRYEDFVAFYSLAWEIPTLIDWEQEQYLERRPRLLPNLIRKFEQSALLQFNFIPIQSIMFDRRLFDIFGGFDESLDQLEDWNLWIRYSHAGDFYFIPRVTSIFRVPTETAKSIARQSALDAAYDDARARALRSVKSLQRRAYGWNDLTKPGVTDTRETMRTEPPSTVPALLGDSDRHH